MLHKMRSLNDHTDDRHQDQWSNLINEGVTEWTFGAKLLDHRRHVLFCLRIKRWIFNQTINKNPHVTFDLCEREKE